MTVSQMRAVQFRRFGDPEVLEVASVPRPVPGPDEVLVEVAASTVNPFDGFVRSGAVKLVTGRKLPMGVGLDFAGRVAATGAGVADLPVGARVWGMMSPTTGHVTGSAADFVVVPAERVSTFPDRLSPVEAASLVTSGATAVRALVDVAQTRPGERVLVRGAAGGVGMIVVQLAHALGAQVTALAGGADLPFVSECGADELFDYRTVGARDLGHFDVIVDTAGHDLLSFRRRLGRGGRMITVNFGSAGAMASIAVSTLFGPRRIRTFRDYPDNRQLVALAGYVEDGSVRPVVGRVYPLDQVADAHGALSDPGRHGKLVLTLTQ